MGKGYVAKQFSDIPLPNFCRIMLKSSPLINTVLIILILALPILNFFTYSQLVIKSIIFSLAGTSLIFTTKTLIKNNSQTKNLIYAGSTVLILVLLCNFKNSTTSISFSVHFGLIAICLLFINKITELSNSFISIGMFFIVTIETLLLLISSLSASVSFYPNNSILSILLSCQFAFLAPKIIAFIQSRIRNKTNRISSLIGICFLCYLILFITSGRAGLLSFSITILFLNIEYFKKSIPLIKVMLISIALILLGLLFIVKLESSNGRILIYKVVVSSIKPIQLLTGIGYGQFKAQYNHYQSEYFSNHPINHSEALLADNTYYAFNDPFQLILEIGITGLAIFLIFIKTLSKKFMSDLRNGLLENSILSGAYLCIFSFLTSSLFSYPFQVLSILPLFLLSLAIVFGSIRHETKMLNDIRSPIIHRVKFLLYSGISIFLLFLGYKFLNTHYKIKEAENLAKAGFKRKSVAIFSDLSNDIIVDRNIYYPFAMELAKLNKTDTAIIVLKKSIKFIYNDHSALLLANLYYDKGLLNLADSFYKESVFINPKSFRNRFALFTFYVDTKQNDKSLYWGKSIIELKPKVASETVTNIKNQTANILQKIQNK
jgi:tetratricopeptide (TPR) repeat protein